MSLHYYALPLVEIRAETADSYTLILANLYPDRFQYQAGQYLTIKVQIEGQEYRRAYSLSSTPGEEKNLAVTIKRVEGGLVSNYLADHLSTGQRVEVFPPMGNFVVVPQVDRTRHYILIGAGSGITPLFAMLKTVLAEEPLSKVSLWYGNRNQEQIIFREELSALGKRYGDRLHVYHTLSQPSADWKGYTGRLDEERIYDLLLELFMRDDYRKRYFLCGPQGMMDAAEAAMEKHSVNFDDVEREFFNAPLLSETELITAQTGTPDSPTTFSDGTNDYPLVEQEVRLHLDGERHLLSVRPDQTLLEAAREADLEVPYSCLSGTCSSCKAKLLTGTTVLTESSGLTDTELEEGYLLTCQAHPLDDKVEVAFESP